MAERYIPEHRRTQFKAKNTFKPEELRRRREEQQVEIRKARREENLAKRRGIGTGDSRPGASLGAAPDSDDETVPTESQVCIFLFPFSIFLWPMSSVSVPLYRVCFFRGIILPRPSPFHFAHLPTESSPRPIPSPNCMQPTSYQIVETYSRPLHSPLLIPTTSPYIDLDHPHRLAFQNVWCC